MTRFANEFTWHANYLASYAKELTLYANESKWCGNNFTGNSKNLARTLNDNTEVNTVSDCFDTQLPNPSGRLFQDPLPP